MSDVFVFTASNPIAQHHWRDSIANPVDPELVYATFPSSTHVELDNIRDRCQGFFCWGATPGDSNIPTWEMMKIGDLVLGYYKKRYRCATFLEGRYQNANFAKRLWGTNDKEQTWEYMYFLRQPIYVSVHATELSEIFGGGPQGFKHVANFRTEILLAEYGSFDRFVQKGLVEATQGEAEIDLSDLLQPPPSTTQTMAELSESQMDELASEHSGSGGFDPVNVEDARERALRAIVARRGQPQFRRKLLLAYGEQCAITGFDCPSALEAAHITPYMGEHTNTASNGLLLRSDIHTLFDCGELAIDSEDMTVVISDRLANSRYKYLAGAELRLPPLAIDCPSNAALEKHREETGL